jgi:DNA-binding NtrC family response regulator
MAATAPLGRILVVDDDLDMCEVLRSSLEYEGFRVETCQNLDQMKTKIKQYSFDAILLDLVLGEESGIEALPFVVREVPFSVVIVMTAYGSIELAVEAMGAGATSFLTKSDDPNKITKELKAKLEIRPTAGVGSDGVFKDLSIIGRSPAMLSLQSDIEHIKDTEATVLIHGESGTGKELVARALHRLSKRSNARFEALNCAAIPENLLESELFGHKRGAFTDAKTDRKGIFEVCSDGTLLLDEIGEMPLSLQSKLLRVLQEREVTPVGGSGAIKVNTRVVAATNRDLEEEVGRGRFREDLYFRLNVLPIHLPALRERPEDIPLLVESFVQKFNNRYAKAIQPPTLDLLIRLKAYQWPGNVRELENAIERAVILSKDDQLHLEDILRRKQTKLSATDLALQSLGAGDNFSYVEAKEAFEKAFLMRILTASKGSIAEAARLSGRYRSDIYRLMDKYGISKDDFKG